MQHRLRSAYRNTVKDLAMTQISMSGIYQFSQNEVRSLNLTLAKQQVLPFHGYSIC